MPLYTTQIKLQSATDSDYNRLSDELKKYSFKVCMDNKSKKAASSEGSVILSTNQQTLFEVTSSVFSAASTTGKKFSFTVRREKVSS
jgi:hypothetical protein